MEWNDTNIIGLTGIVATLAGSLITYHYPIIFEKITKNKSLPEGLIDSWFSTWQTNEGKSSNWVEERIKIKQKGSEVFFENYENTGKYKFIAKGSYIAPHFLIGRYESKTKPKNDGAFILLCLNENELIGLFLGPSECGNTTFGAWVLTKDKNYLNQAKINLAKHAPTLHELFALATA